MAKQTINIGASPNDGTGTPLRTSFDYCNLNFTELYTATGPSGNNIVVPGTATITGALTIGGATSFPASVINTSGGNPVFTPTAATLFLYSGSSFLSIRNQANTQEIFNLTPAGVYTFGDGAGGTRMTLNSTGLGIGNASPGYKLVVAAASGNVMQFENTSDSSRGGRITNTGTAGTGKFGITTTSSGYALSFGIDAVEKMLLDTSGNVGIGVTPSAWLSSLSALQVKGVSGLYGAGSSEFGSVQNCFYNASSQWIYGTTAASGRYAISSGVHQWFNAPSGTAGNAITFTQAMTLDASGNLLVGTTSALASGSTFQNLGSARQVLTLKGDAFGSYTAGVWNASTTNDGLFVYFGTEATLTVRGGISYNRAGGLVAYNTTSDYRAKDIIGPVSNSGSIIDSLKVYLGKMKGATIARPMLIAHEAQEVAPYSVTGLKDEVDADGKDKYQQMDVSSFVPLLIAEIQSLRTRVQTLEAR